jgi:hypothetical protein
MILRTNKMTKQKKKPGRDIEKHYTQQQFGIKLRRPADRIEQGKTFCIQVAGDTNSREQ